MCMKGKTLYNGEWFEAKQVALKSWRHISTVYKQRMKIDGWYMFKTHISPPLVVGSRVGMLTVLDELDPNQKRKSTYDRLVLCQCDCWNKKFIKYKNLYNLASESCWCMQSKKSEFTKEERDSKKYKSLYTKYTYMKNSFWIYYFNEKWKNSVDFIKFFLYNDCVDWMSIVKEDVSIPMWPDNYMLVDKYEARRSRRIERLRRKL